MKEVGDKYLKSNPKHKEQPWMTDDILQLMDLRRGCKNRDAQRYKEIQREIRLKIRTAKENWFSERCEEIEALESKHDSFNLHKKVKEVSGNYRHNRSQILMDEHNNILTSTQDKLKEWCKYVENLFDSNRNGDHNFESSDGLDITKSEVEYAITTAKNGKSPGPDGIYAEILKVLLQDSSLSVLVNLFNNIYQTGIIPKDWLKSTFVTLPKKPSAKYCREYRTISLMSHVLKIFLKIIHNRIYRKCEETISDSQFGFRNGFGTREALFSVQVLIQRCRDVNIDVFACFLDYEKAFDTVNHDKLVNILKDLALDDRDICIIVNLYWNQVATVRVDGEVSDEIVIKRGVRQGCVLSPLLFNLYAEKIFREALDDKTIGVVVGGQVVNNLRYADDTVLLATNIEDLQELITTVAEHSAAMNIKLNIKKTKWLVVSKNPVHVHPNLTVGNEVVERVHFYKYLGCQVNDKWDMTSEIRSRIEQARRSFTNMKKVFTNRHLQISLRVRLLRCYVFSILFYGVEAWTLTEAMCRKLEAFEMWTYRRLLKVSWADRVTNVDILQRVNKQKEVLNTIKRRKLEYFGHVMRNDKYKLLHIIIQGKIEGKRGPGRRRISWLKNLRQWYGLSTTSLFRKAADKVKVMQLIVNALGGHDT